MASRAWGAVGRDALNLQMMEEGLAVSVRHESAIVNTRLCFVFLASVFPHKKGNCLWILLARFGLLK